MAKNVFSQIISHCVLTTNYQLKSNSTHFAWQYDYFKSKKACVVSSRCITVS